MTTPAPKTIEREKDSVRARTVKEFCRAYGVGKSTAYELIAEGTLNAVKMGKRTLIVEESAAHWFNSLPATSTHNRTHK